MSYLTAARRSWRKPMRSLGFELERSSFVRRLGPVAHYVDLRQSSRPEHALVSLVVTVANPKASDPDAADVVFAMAYLGSDGVRFGTRTPWPTNDLVEGHAAFAAYGLPHFAKLSTLEELREVLVAATAEHKLVARHLAGEDHGVLDAATAELLGAPWRAPEVRDAPPPINQALLAIIESYAR